MDVFARQVWFGAIALIVGAMVAWVYNAVLPVYPCLVLWLVVAAIAFFSMQDSARGACREICAWVLPAVWPVIVWPVPSFLYGIFVSHPNQMLVSLITAWFLVVGVSAVVLTRQVSAQRCLAVLAACGAFGYTFFQATNYGYTITKVFAWSGLAVGIAAIACALYKMYSRKPTRDVEADGDSIGSGQS